MTVLGRAARRDDRPAGVFEVADEFFLLGVHRNDRLLPPLKGKDRSVDVAKLRVSVWVTEDQIIDLALEG